LGWPNVIEWTWTNELFRDFDDKGVRRRRGAHREIVPKGDVLLVRFLAVQIHALLAGRRSLGLGLGSKLGGRHASSLKEKNPG
jgi:hypothetical protein